MLLAPLAALNWRNLTLTKERIMPNVNSYWLTKAIDFIDVLADSGTKEEIKTKNQMIVEFYSLIKEDFKNRNS